MTFGSVMTETTFTVTLRWGQRSRSTSNIYLMSRAQLESLLGHDQVRGPSPLILEIECPEGGISKLAFIDVNGKKGDHDQVILGQQKEVAIKLTPDTNTISVNREHGEVSEQEITLQPCSISRVRVKIEQP